MMKQYYPSAGEIVLLPYERIISHPVRDTEAYTESALAELVFSIQTNGLLEPITVSVLDERFYRVASGERRFRACVIAGLKEIPCIIAESSEDADSLFALIEDVHHERIHYLDRAALINRLVAEDGLSLYRLSELSGISVSRLFDDLKLLQMPGDMLSLLKQKGISESHANLLVTVGEEQRRGVLNKIIEEGFSLTETEAYIHRLSKRGCQGNIMIFKDLNVFVNTVEHAVETMNRSGIASAIDRTETEEQITYTVTIRKTG